MRPGQTVRLTILMHPGGKVPPDLRHPAPQIASTVARLDHDGLAAIAPSARDRSGADRSRQGSLAADRLFRHRAAMDAPQTATSPGRTTRSLPQPRLRCCPRIPPPSRKVTFELPRSRAAARHEHGGAIWGAMTGQARRRRHQTTGWRCAIILSAALAHRRRRIPRPERRASFHDALARLAEAAITEAEIDRKRWLPIGPSVILKGQASGKPRVAGRVRDIKRSPDGTAHLRGERQWRRVVQRRRRAELGATRRHGDDARPQRPRPLGQFAGHRLSACRVRRQCRCRYGLCRYRRARLQLFRQGHPRFKKRRYRNPQAQQHCNGGARRSLRQPLGSRGAEPDRCRNLPHRARSRSSP